LPSSEKPRHDPESAAHFTRRFESFADVVFGFSLSFLTARLVVPEHAGDIFGKPFGLLVFLGTFAILAAVWVMNHRMFRFYFTPEPLEVVLVFAQLAGVALISYALNLLVLFPTAPETSALYGLDFAAIVGCSAIIAARGFRRNWPEWDLATRQARWQTVILQRAVTLLCLTASLGVLVNFNFVLIFWLIPIVVTVIRKGYRGMPAYARDHAPHGAESAAL